MMKYEFEQIAGYEVSNEDYNNIIEPMYMSTSLTKQDFVKTIDRKRFEVKHKKTQEQIELEESIKAEITQLKETIKWFQDKIEAYKGFYNMDGSQDLLNSIKSMKNNVKIMKNRIKSLKFVLA